MWTDRRWVGDAWSEADHPRGQPENAGQFGSGSGKSKSKRHDYSNMPPLAFKADRPGTSRYIISNGKVRPYEQGSLLDSVGSLLEYDIDVKHSGITKTTGRIEDHGDGHFVFESDSDKMQPVPYKMSGTPSPESVERQTGFDDTIKRGKNTKTDGKSSDWLDGYRDALDVLKDETKEKVKEYIRMISSSDKAQDMTLATDPPVSEAQRRLMWATAAGHGTSGVPQSVGREFANSDPGGHLPARAKDMEKGEMSLLRKLMSKFLGEEEREPEHAQDASKGRAASVAFVAKDGKVLFVRRADDEENFPGHWAFPGGKLDGDEHPMQAAIREAREELGEDCGSFDGMRRIDNRRSPRSGWDHTTFAVPAEDEFEPKLNGEHSEHRWAYPDEPPEPLHPGVRATLEDCMGRMGARDAEVKREPDGKFASAAHHISMASKHRGIAESGSVRGTAQEAPHREAEASHNAARAAHEGYRLNRGQLSHEANEKSRSLGFAKDTADPNGRLSATTRREVDSARTREDMPESAFLLPSQRKYPIKEERDGEYKYTRNLLLAAAKEARMHGRGDLAKRADAIRAREFPSEGEDDWSPEARAAALEARKAHAKLASHHKAEAERHFNQMHQHRSVGNLAGERESSAKWRENKKAAEHHEVKSREEMIPTGGREGSIPKSRVGRVTAALLQGRGRDQAADMAMDWSGAVALTRSGVGYGVAPPVMAFDRASVRTTDEDGRLHIAEANIAKASVNGYLGKEIPDYEKLGLDPERKYMLLRDPAELKKSVDTFNNLPILSKHQAVTADSFPQDLVVGSTGSDAKWEPPFIKNSLVFWPKKAIDGIESNVKKSLSPAYRYDCDLTSGMHEGVPFQGIMRNIRANHLAQVEEGRQGPDVVVGDAAPSRRWRATRWNLGL